MTTIRYSVTAIAMAALALLSVEACGAPGQRAVQQRAPDQAAPQQPAPQQPAPRQSPPAPESVRANELGDVPVLMYHRISADPDSVYERTPQDFRGELERLAAEDYVPVTASEYASGDIDIPAGKHPVVLTFDDSSTTQFTLDSSGRPIPDSAVGILLDVSRSHPGFRPTATFYAFDPPFEEPDGRRSLNWLHEHGFEIGNHTLNHPNLGKVSAEQAQREIAGMQQVITAAVPGIPVRSLALPLGRHPEPEALAVDGSADGTTYHHDSVMLVGSNPAHSPWSEDFDRTSVPRVRSQGPEGEDAEYGSTAWLDKLAADPDSRYTSDGDPARVSAPAESTEEPSPDINDRLHRY